MAAEKPGSRIVKSVHGRQERKARSGLSARSGGVAARPRTEPRGSSSSSADLRSGDGPLDVLMRRCIWRAAARRCGHGLQVGSGVGFKHLETFEIGDSVFIGAQAYIQGRFDGTDHHRQPRLDRSAGLHGRPRPGDRGLRWLGTGREGPRVGAHRRFRPTCPSSTPTSRSSRCAIEAWADIGTNATILPGVTIGTRRHRRRRRGGDAGRRRHSPLSPACPRDSCAGARAHRTSRLAGRRQAQTWSRSSGTADNAIDSDRQADARRARSRGGPPRHPVGLGDARARKWRHSSASSPSMSARRTPARCRTARPRCTSRCWPWAWARATRSSPSATRSSPPRTPSATAARRRCSSTSKLTASTWIRR